MPEKTPYLTRLSLQTKFLLPILVFFVLLAALFGIQVTQAIRAMVFEQAKETAAEWIAYFANQMILPEYLINPYSRDYEPAFSRFASYVQNANISEVTVWNSQGRILFPQDQSQLGKSFSENAFWQKAIHGEVAIEDRDPPAQALFRASPEAIWLFVPIVKQASGTPLGVVEVRYTLLSVESNVQKIQVLVWGIIGMVFIILFIALATFLRMFVLRPLHRLDQMATAAGGTSTYRVNTNDEIARLSESIQKMKWVLEVSAEELEKKVRDRTRALKKTTDELEKEKHIYEDSNKELTDTKRAVLNILEDVQEAKNEISQEKSRLEAILKSIGEGVYVVDLEHHILLFNRQAEKLLGFSEKEAVSKTTNEILHLFDQKGNPVITMTHSPVDEIWQSGRSDVIRNVELARKDTTRFPAVLSAAPIVSREKIIAGVVAFRDVTLEKEIDTMKSEFVSVASHQLRTPLSAIKWFLEMLIAGDAGGVNETQKEFLDRAYESNERMIKLVNDLLNVSRMEAGKIKFEPKPFRMETIFQSVIGELTPLARARNITVTSAMEGEKLPEVLVDPDRMRQVVQNLVSNAIKYTNGHGKVEVFYERRPNELVFHVKDTGIGIPKDQQHKLFNKFFRADNVLKIQTDGSGLGLYIAKAMVETSGGQMWFVSKEGEGSTFSFSLPIHKLSKVPLPKTEKK